MAENVLEDTMDISKLKVPDLKRELKARGLSTTGNKNELQERLQGCLKSKVDDLASAESVDDLDDDLLNDDDLDHDETLDGSESVLTDLDAHLDVTSTVKVPKRKSQSQADADDHSKPAKKIVLNRTPSTVAENRKNGSLDTEETASTNSEQKQVIKFSDVGVKERLEMRAKKFGVPLSTEARKAARAQRFGGATITAPSKGAISTGGNVSSVETLKKRAERFGGSVSTVMSKLDLQERLEKRKARFGAITTSNGSVSQTEKAKQRLERFKTPIK